MTLYFIYNCGFTGEKNGKTGSCSRQCKYEIDLFFNIRNMTRSALVPFILSCILYGILGFSVHTGSAADTTRNLLQDYYEFSPLMLLPVVIVLVLSLLHVDVKKTIAFSGLVGMAIAVSLQHFPVSELPALCFSGFSPSDGKIAKLMSGGGFLSMLRVYLIDLFCKYCPL